MIYLNNISKSYDDKMVLSDFSLEVKEGEKFCIMGRSGTGKSTLLNIIMGLEKPDKGSVQINSNIKFSCVFQENRLVEQLTAEKNIALACSKADIKAAAEKIGLNEEDLRKPVSLLSGGQKRRVAILRAVLYKSDVLIFDEIMQGLDVETENSVMSFVMDNLNKRALIAVTHNSLEAKGYGARIFNID